MKNEFENQIKKQLENRSLRPSEDAWNRLEMMLDENEGKTQKKSGKKWLFFVAAAFAFIAASLFLTNYFSTTTNDFTHEPTVTQNPVPVIVEDKIIEKIKTENEMISEPNIKSVPTKESKPLIAEIKPQKLQPEIKMEVLQKEEINPIIQIAEAPETVLTLITDSVPKKQKKKNYVDPEMLLYSIENNEALNQKDNLPSKLVIVDFNK